jgi:ribosomal subunit interface protein
MLSYAYNVLILRAVERLFYKGVFLMQVPVKITFHNVDASEALEARINEKIAKLEGRYSGLVGCQVVVESAHHHQTKGRLYSVLVDVTLPGGKLVASSHTGKNPEKHDKVFAAMNDAFMAVEKQLEKFKDLVRRDIKQHEPSWLVGVVGALNTKDGFGFIKSPEGGEAYFHRNAVLNGDYELLDVGAKVRYVLSEEGGDNGPQASAVKLSAKKKVSCD